ncbi:UvrD-helicase domain-containing protein [Aquabacterium sp.]|uniref:UvrD-helicase domain-containing protein n=1 Tax=Aquabacterium sp. TaxID=1872578 RepID=UPI002CD3BAE5|nr:UvrD-helicase domain-containing protein [Aquabacterium sp.]HSW06434.1 UvrD-helicase domain-containing protein [Aquabacterium sp.]
MNIATRFGRLSPSEEQQAVLRSAAQYKVIEAAAGAAKTTTLALCIAQAVAQRVPAARILALTHTPAAVQAMAAALDTVGITGALRQVLRKQAVVDFDNFSRAVLDRCLGPVPQRCSDREQLRPFLQQAADAVRDDEDEAFPQDIDAAAFGDHEGLLNAFARLKGRMAWWRERLDRRLSPELAAELGESYTALRVFQHYEQLLRWSPREEAFMFRGPGDAVYDLASLLHNGELEPRVLGHFDLVLVDEMHDTNWAMFTVLQHLLVHANPAARFVGVGDADQVIHTAACADAGFMREHFDGWIAVRGPTALRLSRSYRYGPALARAAQAVAGKPCASALGRDTAIELLSLPLASADMELALQLERLIKHDGVNPGDLAVLLRQPHQSVGLEHALLRRGVPYRSVGMMRCLARPAVLFVWGLVALASDALAGVDAPATRHAMLAAMARFLGVEPDLAALKTAAAGNDYDLRHYARNQLVGAADGEFARRAEAFMVRCLQPLTVDTAPELMQLLGAEGLARRCFVRRADAQDAMLDMQATLDLLCAERDGVPAFLRTLNAHDQLAQQHRADVRCVRLDTIEAVKGLEFEQVWMPGLDAASFEIAADDALESNLFYVGITRARQRLVLIHDATQPAGKPLQRLAQGQAGGPASIASP